MNHLPIFAIAIPLLVGFLVPLIGKINSTLRNIISVTAVGVELVVTILIFYETIKNGLITYVIGAKLPIPTNAEMPVRIILNIDALGGFFALIFALLAFLATIFSWKFFVKQGDAKNGYYTLLMILAGAGAGLAYTGDLFNLFVFLELTSLSAVGLIAFRASDVEPSEAAFKFLVISSVAAWMFLVATGFLYGKYDALNIAFIAQRMSFGVIDKITLVLFIGSLGLKFGMVPMHMWVPDTYGESPAPISMVLVALSQLSLYALIRIIFTLFGNPITLSFGWIIVVFSLLTMVIAATMALLQNKIKRLIAYSAVSQVGYMLLGIGVGLISLKQGNLLNFEEYGLTALEGGIFHILNDAIIMALMFVVAGSIIRQVGKEDLNSLGGLARKMPFTSTMFLIGGAAVAGLPPLNGFASKLVIYESVFKLNPFLTAVALLVSIFTMAIYVKAFQGAFLGPEMKEFSDVKEIPNHIKMIMIILVALIIIIGLFPGLVIDKIIEPVAQAVINYQSYIRGVL